MARIRKRSQREKKLGRCLVFVIVLLLVWGCQKPITTNDTITIINHETYTPPSDTGKEIELYFCPRDNCNNFLTEFLSSAEETIHCAFFDLDLEDVIIAFDTNYKNGIDVRVVVDNHYEHELNNFTFIRFDNQNQLSHNKFCILDNHTVWTGSFNPTERGSFHNNNNALKINSQALVKNYNSEFQELWNGTFGKGEKIKFPYIYYNHKKIENYFCPEDQCAQRLIDVLSTANKSINFMTFSFTHDDVGDTLIKLHKNGIEVKGLFEKTQASKYSELDKLEKADIEVDIDKNPANLHHKVFIIDNLTVVTGSFNPSANADKRNDENVIIIYDPDIAEKYLEEFNNLWHYGKEAENISIVLSEVYYDTEGKDAEEEFIELYNPTEQEIDITAWKLYYGKKSMLLKETIQPKTTLVIQPLKFGLSNRGAKVELKNTYGQVADSVAWEKEWQLTAQKGESLQRDFFDEINDEEEWGVNPPTKGNI